MKSAPEDGIAALAVVVDAEITVDTDFELSIPINYTKAPESGVVAPIGVNDIVEPTNTLVSSA
jgi:hypothetical protein